MPLSFNDRVPLLQRTVAPPNNRSFGRTVNLSNQSYVAQSGDIVFLLRSTDGLVHTLDFTDTQGEYGGQLVTIILCEIVGLGSYTFLGVAGQPPLDVQARRVTLVWDDNLKIWNPVFGTNGDIALPDDGDELTTDFAETISAPTYVTVLTISIASVLPTSFVFFSFTSTWRHTGGFAGNAAVNFRFRLNGTLVLGGTTDNKVRGQIGCVARTGRPSISQGTQVLAVEVTKFGAAGNTILISVASLPDLNHCALFMQEVA